MDEQDRLRRSIAVHEAGHALVYSARIPMPARLRIVVRSQPTCNVGGYATTGDLTRPPETLDTMGLVHYMLIQLGGQAAEKTILGQDSKLASEDLEKWSRYVHLFLAKSPSVGWTQENLYETQMNLLGLFFGRNENIMLVLAEEAIMHREVLLQDFLRTAPPIWYPPSNLFPRPAGLE